MEALPQLSEEEFEQIEEAVARTAKGRAFLRRFHRRALGAAGDEIRLMLQEFRLSWQRQGEIAEAAKHVDVLRRELMEMAGSIEQARREVAALRPPDGANDKIMSATSELDAIVISTERASFEILNAAERLMDVSGRLRAAGGEAELCAEIDAEVNNIFTACSFQDLTGQRTSKVVNALRYIEQRINAMISIWGPDGIRDLNIVHENTDTRPDAHLLNGPQLDGHGVSQADVDNMFDAPPPAAPPAPAPAPAPAANPPKASQSDIDSMFDAPAPAPAANAPKASQSDIDSMFDAPSPAPAPAANAPKASQSDIDSMFDAPAPAPAPAKPASQSDIDSMFDAPAAPAAKPAPAAAPAAKAMPRLKPTAKPAATKAAAAPAPVPAKTPAKAPEPEKTPSPLDQSAIDALFG